MKKALALFAALLLSLPCLALDFGPDGSVWLAGPVIQNIVSGTAMLWEEPFDADLATTTWTTTAWNAADDGLGILVTGGKLYVGAGKPGDLRWPTFKPTGISRIVAGNFTATTKVNFNAAENYQVAGIMATSADCQGTTYIAKAFDSGAGGEILFRRDMHGGNYYDSSKPAFTADDFYLKLQRSGNTVGSFYSSDGSSWTPLATTASWTIGANDSVNLWLLAFHTNAGGALATATFDYLNITFP